MTKTKQQLLAEAPILAGAAVAALIALHLRGYGVPWPSLVPVILAVLGSGLTISTTISRRARTYSCNTVGCTMQICVSGRGDDAQLRRVAADHRRHGAF